MNREARKKKISDTAANLIVVKEALDAKERIIAATSRKWRYLWIAAGGACYSLYCAEKHVDSAFYQRKGVIDLDIDVTTKVDGVNSVLVDIVRAREPSLAKKDSWLLSYYSKGAEVRICQVLERSLKLFLNYTKNMAKIAPLAKGAIAQLVGTQKGAKAVKILEEFLSHSDPDWKDRSVKAGRPLRRVWRRVNQFKHKGLQNVDEQDPRFRFSDALYGLHDLVEVFLDLVHAI